MGHGDCWQGELRGDRKSEKFVVCARVFFFPLSWVLRTPSPSDQFDHMMRCAISGRGSGVRIALRFVSAWYGVLVRHIYEHIFQGAQNVRGYLLLLLFLT